MSEMDTTTTGGEVGVNTDAPTTTLRDEGSDAPIVIDSPLSLQIETDFEDHSETQEPEEVEEVDWDTLNKLDAHVQQEDPLTGPVDNEFLRLRAQREGNVEKGHTKTASTSSAGSRRTSLQQIRRTVVDTVSRLPTPTLARKPQYGHARNESKEILLTDLELWTALVSDYTQTALRLPTLTTRKIHAGIPQPLRGLVWQAMSGARDTHLEGLYDSLCVEKNAPYEKIIGRDLMRTFPQVEMFRQEGGEGQSDLGKVLRAFSLYDTEVGYCQGLGFIVAPLLMNMSHQEAFCVLVRIMEGYGMRSMFTSTLAGLKLRLFQFEQLFEENAGSLAEHLKTLGVFPAMYLSQWFLSVYAVSCPLPTLHRIYDVFLAEGAPETMMRLALALLIKNRDRLLEMDMEEVMHLLLGAGLWEVYDEDDDLLIADTTSLSDRITTHGLAELEAKYQSETDIRPSSQLPEGRGLQAAASAFLGRINPGRLFSGSFSGTASLPADVLEAAAKMSRISTTSSVSTSFKAELENAEESSNSSYSRDSAQSLKKHSESLERENRQLNYQIEDMITALSDSHKQVANLREEKDKMIATLDEFKVMTAELLDALASSTDDTRNALVAHWSTELSGKLEAEPLSVAAQLSAEKIKFLEQQLDDRNHEVGRMRSSMMQAKVALEAIQRDKAKLEKALNDVRLRREKTPPVGESGVSQLKLARQNSAATIPQLVDTTNPTAPTSLISGPMRAFRRVSTYASNAPSPSEAQSPDATPSARTSDRVVGMTAHEEEVDSLRLELVQAKASIAIYQQEADEAKYALRMSLNANGAVAASSVPVKGHVKRLSVNRAESAPAEVEQTHVSPAIVGPEKPLPSTWFWKRS